VSQSSLQSALQTLLKALPALADKPGGLEVCTISSLKPMDAGVTHCAAIWPGTAQGGEAAGYEVSFTWSIPLDLIIRYTSDEVSYPALTAFLDDVIALLVKYPTLNGQGSVTLERVSADADPLEVNDKTNGGPFFLLQTIRVEITERVALSGGEYT
jgi:hypothetical protein